MPDAGSWSVPGYTLVRPLGGGETGNVVLATHDASGRSVAIKYLSARLLGRAEFVERFRGEARALAGLTDPNVARLLEYVEAPPAGAAIVMEPVDGITLRRVLDTRGSMPPEAALVLLRGSLSGLAAAHAAGVVHRDYKPGNVLVRRDGSTALVDFGIAVRAGEGAVAEGTPAYMPPEQWAGAPLGPAADVYAATAVFYECLTGRPPYSPEGSAGSVDLAGLARAHQSAPIPLDDVPEPVRALVARGLAKDPRPAAWCGGVRGRARSRGYGPRWAVQGGAALAGAVGAVAAFLPGAAGVGGVGGTAASGSATGALGARADGVDGMGTAVNQGARPADLARGGDGARGDGLGTSAGQQSPTRADGDLARSGDGRLGDATERGSTSDGLGSAAGRPRRRRSRAAVVIGAGLGVAAVVAATVLVVRQPDEPPPASAAAQTPEVAVPASPPSDSGEAGDVIEAQTTAEGTASFDFTWGGLLRQHAGRRGPAGGRRQRHRPGSAVQSGGLPGRRVLTPGPPGGAGAGVHLR